MPESERVVRLARGWNQSHSDGYGREMYETYATIPKRQLTTSKFDINVTNVSVQGFLQPSMLASRLVPSFTTGLTTISFFQ